MNRTMLTICILLTICIVLALFCGEAWGVYSPTGFWGDNSPTEFWGT